MFLQLVQPKVVNNVDDSAHEHKRDKSRWT